MKRFGVIGHPIAHSLSPFMHSAAFSLLGLDCTYEAFDIEPGKLSDSLRDFKSRGFDGLNITIPHKEGVLPLLDTIGEEAKAVGAVNTLLFSDRGVRGENTDVYGIVKSLEGIRHLVSGKAAVVLGAGGSARAAAYALLTKSGASEIVIANRTVERARDLVNHLVPYAGEAMLRSSSMDEATLESLLAQAILVVNATSVGMSPDSSQSPVGDNARFREDQIVLDLIYTPLETRLLAQARRDGARTISGLELFLYQGARSFELWLERQFPIESVRKVVLEELKRRA